MGNSAATLDQEFADLAEDFYPGSTRPIAPRPRRLHTSAALAAGNWDATPRRYTVSGETVEFFTVGHLATALGRQAGTIRKWEREGVIPKSTYQSPGQDGDPRGRRRLYTRAQVVGIVRIAAAEGVLTAHQNPIRATNFTARVIDLFKELAEQ